MSQIQRWSIYADIEGNLIEQQDREGIYVTHANHLADRAELVSKLEDAQDKLRRILEWRKAYPLDIFPKPDLEADRKLLGDGEFTRLNAYSMRHVLEGIENIIESLEGA
jgi:hypothetical protein